MLDLIGGGFSTCDGVRRRAFLRVGALGLLGVSMADVLRSRSLAKARGEPSNETAVIQVLLGGGPSQLETYDPKPDAPAEFRGELGAISTNVAGVALGELFPRQARLMDKLALVRSLHHDTSDHAAGSHWVLTGSASGDPTPRVNDRPSVGSVAARLRGANRPGLPAYVALPRPPAFAQGAYLGPAYNPFSPDASAGVDAPLRDLERPDGLSPDRLDDRRGLLARLDRLERSLDPSGTMAGMDRFTADAYTMITGPEARRAFDLTREDPRLRDRYGRTPVGQGCLLARRLVEAGVTFVTVVDGGWDHHSQVFANCRAMLPALDAAVATLVDDLHDRGLDRRVLVLVWGEFGRTPRVNGSAGRDHWPGAFSALLAGGGLKTGQILGASGRRGEAPTERPVRPGDVVATVYQVLGIDPTQTFADASGRPIPVLSEGRPIAELF